MKIFKEEILTKKYLLLLMFFILFVGNIVIVLKSWNSIVYTSEFAGSLINLFKKLKIILRVAFYTGVSSSFLFLLNQFCVNLKIQLKFEILVLLLSVGLLIYLSYYSYNTKFLATSSSQNLSYLKLKYNKKLNKSEFFIPSIKVIEKDKSLIINAIKTFLDQDNSMDDSLYITKFDFLFDSYVENLEKKQLTQYKKILKDSLTIDFINYSPDFQYLFSILSYNTSIKNSQNKFFNSNAFVIIGEKKDGKLFLYRIDVGTNQQGVESKEFAFYSKLLQMYPEVFKKDFWVGDNFKKIKIEEKFFYKFQLNWHTKYSEKGEIIEYDIKPFWVGIY